jgi:hypothetical protein
MIRYFDISISGPPAGVSTYQKEGNFATVFHEGYWIKLRRRDVGGWVEIEKLFAKNELMEDHKDIQL